MSTYARIEVPREGVNDDTVRVVEWLVADGEQVEAGQPVVVIETTKSAVDLNADQAGFLFHLAKAETDVPVGAAVAAIAPTAQRPADLEPATPAGGGAGSGAADPGTGLITAKARALMAEHGIAEDVFAGRQVVRTSDVEEYLSGRSAAARPAQRRFRGDVLDPDADWDAVLSDGLYRELTDLLTRLRKRMKARWDRHVSVGDLLLDRWELAREYGFGEGTSVYEDCRIFGAVTMGDNCWVGPGCILDGSGGGLTIGDHVDIAAGSHVYTHNTIERALTGHRAPILHKPTRIGNCCFIGPHSIIAPGTVLGDHCFVAAGSYVDGVFEDHSLIAGSPAKRVGTVELSGDRARLRREQTQ